LIPVRHLSIPSVLQIHATNTPSALAVVYGDKTMTWGEFNKLDEATRLAVIREILKQENNPLGPNGESVGQMLVEAACQFLPQATVSEVLMGTPPR